MSLSRFAAVDFEDFLLATQFHFRSPLGRGAFAAVWLADERAGSQIVRQVAVKVFLAPSIDRDEIQKTARDFETDLLNLGRLGAGHAIVQYFTHVPATLCVIDGRAILAEPGEPGDAEDVTGFFIVMEYADGGPIGNAYREQFITANEREVYLNHFIDLCRSLDFAHRAGVIHRDIKPSNLLWFKEFNQVKISDFGIAKNPTDLKASLMDGDSISGTLEYMSPESFTPGAPPLPARDVYALGCTFFEVLTGRKAFDESQLPTKALDNKNVDRISIFQVAHSELPRPDAYTLARDFVTLELSDLITKMMSIDPERRPNLREVVNALQAQVRQVQESRATRGGRVVELPDGPKFLSEYNVSPRFRSHYLGESMFFIFVNLQHHSVYRYTKLLGLLGEVFGDSYSFFEVFGKHDFVIRVWTNRRTASQFCKDLVKDVLEGDRSRATIFVCDSVKYFSDEMRADRDKAFEAKVLVELRRAQDSKHTEHETAIRWLRQNKIFTRPIRAVVTRHEVKAFCLLSVSREVSHHDLEAMYALLESTVNANFSVAKYKISIYRRHFDNLEGFVSEGCHFIVSYTAPYFDEAISIPRLVVEQLSGHRLEPATLIATKRFYIVSDRVLVDR